ncbi:MAG: hypothetical protein EXR99_04315 [Gemmataceae bacterium]|nr:hypothetical protein [Gemmataceae bacterium]
MKRRKKLEVSTFPFLAVLLCTMGSLILLLLVIDRKAKKAALEKTYEAARLAQDKNSQDSGLSAKLRREEKSRLLEKETQLDSQISRWKSEWEGALQNSLEQKAAEARLNQVVAKKQQLLLSIRAASQDLEKTKGGKGLLGKSPEDKTQELQVNINRLEGLLNEHKISKDRDTPSFSIVPYFGNQGSNRRPLYLECTEAGIMFHPDGMLFSPKENPGELASELRHRTGLLRALLQATKDDPNPVPYLMILIRPKGIAHYWNFQAILKQFDLEFGYELVDQEWKIAIPEEHSAPAPKVLAAMVQKAGGLPRPMPAPGIFPGGANLNNPPKWLDGSAGNSGRQGPVQNSFGASAKTVQPIQGPPGFPLARGNPPSFPGSKGNGLNGIDPYAIGGKSKTEIPTGFGENPGSNPNNQIFPNNQGNSLSNNQVKQNGLINSLGKDGKGNENKQNNKPEGIEGDGIPGNSPAMTGSPGIGKGLSNSEPGSGKPTKSGNPQGNSSEMEKALAQNKEYSKAGKENGLPKQPGTPTQKMVNPNGPPQNISLSPKQSEANLENPRPLPRTTYAPPSFPDQSTDQETLSKVAVPLPELGPRKSQTPAPLRPARIFADRDWPIFLECKFDELVLHPNQVRIPTTELGQGAGLLTLNEEIKRMIRKKQETLRPGEAPYRAQIRFLVWPDGLRSYHLAYPVLEWMKLPQTRQNLDADDNLTEVLNRR